VEGNAGVLCLAWRDGETGVLGGNAPVWTACIANSRREEVQSRKSCGESLENSKRAATAQFEHRSSHKIDMAAKAQHMKNPTFTLHCPF
jgi:hypothetical protein